ncbi:MAG: AMP-binding protein [Candidatus Wallbacteria bacterium]|nr:AMP-binding protein [Candidatus Wallbacteria bacterium]
MTLNPWGRNDMNLSELVFQSCDRFAGRVALVEGDRQVTYRELERDLRRWAGQLIEKGGFRDETVALLMPNGVEFVGAYFGALAAGKSALPLNPLLTIEELDFILRDAGVGTLVASKSMMPKAQELAARLPKLRHVLPSALPGEGPEGAGFARREDLATLLYTSGTTGKPKGVMLTHANLIANIEGCLAMMDVGPDDRFLAVLPFFHAFGLTASLAIPLSVGASVELMPSIQPGRILAAISERGVTCLLAVPSVFGILAKLAPAGASHALRLAVAGGEPLPERIFHAWQAKFGVPLREGYGATETAPVISMTPAGGESRPGRAGRPLANLQVRICGTAGPLPAGEIGEIQVRGPSVMRGYLSRPKETADVLDREGWYRTGDLGRLDDEGFLAITGRKKDLIISAGENIYPAEIEELLRQIPGVAEAAVVGVPDDLRGEVPKAVICPEQGRQLDPTQIRDSLRGHLAEYKMPRFIEFMTELPRTASGKVFKQALLKP